MIHGDFPCFSWGCVTFPPWSPLFQKRTESPWLCTVRPQRLRCTIYQPADLEQWWVGCQDVRMLGYNAIGHFEIFWAVSDPMVLSFCEVQSDLKWLCRNGTAIADTSLLLSHVESCCLKSFGSRHARFGIQMLHPLLGDLRFRSILQVVYFFSSIHHNIPEPRSNCLLCFLHPIIWARPVAFW